MYCGSEAYPPIIAWIIMAWVHILVVDTLIAHATIKIGFPLPMDITIVLPILVVFNFGLIIFTIYTIRKNKGELTKLH